MFLTRNEYDRGVNTFSPEGRLYQVEYAIEATKLGSTAIVIRSSEGVILASEKRSPSILMEPASMEKIMKVDAHIGCTTSGLVGDGQSIVNRARLEAQKYWFTYGDKITVEGVTQSISNLFLEFGDDDAAQAMSRPYGIGLLFAGCDKRGPQLFHMDPSGSFIDCQAKAIGSGSEGAQQSLKERYHENLTLQETEKMALRILKEVMEEKMNTTNIEIAVITPGVGFHLLTKEELEQLIATL